MSLSDSQKTDLTYKRLLGVAETSTSKQFFEEPIASGIIVTPDMIWRDAAYIPATAPNISPSSQDLGGTTYVYGDEGVVRFFYWLSLLPVSGSPGAFYHEQLKDAIPFNHDPAGSYNYRLKNASSFDIAFGVQDWIVDPVAGVLTFFGTNLASIGISPAAPPKISFFKYIGRKGFPSGGGGTGVALPIEDSEALLAATLNPLNTAQFIVDGSGATIYHLPNVPGKNGIVLMRENLNATLSEIGVIDGGETT